MAKSAPISCETAQKSRGRDRGQGRSNLQRRCGRKPQHREKRTSVPCSPVSGAENGLATPPPGAATRDPHPARHLARPAGKRSESSSRKRTIRLHRLDSATLLSAYRSLSVISAARQRSMRPARMSHLAASPLADIANPPHGRKTFATTMDHAEARVKTRYLLRSRRRTVLKNPQSNPAICHVRIQPGANSMSIRYFCNFIQMDVRAKRLAVLKRRG